MKSFTILLILTFFFSCSNNTSVIKKKEMTDEEEILFRKRNGIVGERRLRLVKHNEFGISSTDSILISEKKYNSRGILTYKNSISYQNIEKGIISSISYEEYYDNWVLKYTYDSTSYEYDTYGRAVTEFGPKGIPVKYQVGKFNYNHKGQLLSILSNRNGNRISKSEYKWVNDTTCIYKSYDYKEELQSHSKTIYNSNNQPLEETIFKDDEPLNGVRWNRFISSQKIYL